MLTYFLGLGSNLGDRAMAIYSGLASLGAFGIVVAVSPIYASAPLYVTDQPEFLNAVARFQTDLDPLALLQVVKKIEAEAGREFGPTMLRFGPRLLDIDLLLVYQDEPAGATTPLFVDTAELVIPHPRLPERAFVLIPLKDLAPDLIHPTLGEPIAAMAMRVADQDNRRWHGRVAGEGHGMASDCNRA